MGVKLYERTDKLGELILYTSPTLDEQTRYGLNHLSRLDPILIQVLEELGQAASNLIENIQIIDLPEGTEYKISYDEQGLEFIELKSEFKIKWLTA